MEFTTEWTEWGSKNDPQMAVYYLEIEELEENINLNLSAVNQ